ncbi:arsenate reductase ArsC [Nocardioides sp. J54]|uniref:arsenate reductase ArsC n=1 Tax=Nocardioides sp. J54 TaxID=935866 RepID=UPI00048B4708|nr:arsenate reductase ArsC [Nocardioides sp. J54]
MSSTHDMSVTLDQQIALKTAATRLSEDFAGVFNLETIERFLHSSFNEFAGKATVATFLPLLAERYAKQQLQAAAKIEGKSADGKPVVLFLCVHNAGRSQMALGFFNHHAGDAAVAWSGGSEPGEAVNRAAVAAMAERGIDIAQEFPKPWTDEIVQAADVVVTMGCGDACPYFPGKRYEDWELEDPAGKDVADVRPIRDEIERRVLALLDELDVPGQR